MEGDPAVGLENWCDFRIQVKLYLHSLHFPQSFKTVLEFLDDSLSGFACDKVCNNSFLVDFDEVQHVCSTMAQQCTIASTATYTLSVAVSIPATNVPINIPSSDVGFCFCPYAKRFMSGFWRLGDGLIL